jgi:hypothetical protein
VVSPDVEAAGDVLGQEDLVKLLVVRPTEIFVSSGEDVGVVSVLIEVPGICQVWEVVGR